jgi:hypothetical protein
MQNRVADGLPGFQRRTGLTALCELPEWLVSGSAPDASTVNDVAPIVTVASAVPAMLSAATDAAARGADLRICSLLVRWRRAICCRLKS